MKRLSCLCPSYKRPAMLANAAACFLAQDYPPDSCRLFVLDDAPQFHPAAHGNIEVHVAEQRFPTLPAKLNHLASLAMDWEPDALVLWEDDDCFLPHRLRVIADALESGVRFYRPACVYSDYRLPPDGSLQIESAAGRFHSSWAFTVDVFFEVGGWPHTDRLDFDQQFGSRLRAADPREPISDGEPSYVYRWGRGGWNGSAMGESGYAAHWKRIGGLPAPWIGELVPEFDQQTQAIMAGKRPLTHSAET